MGVEPRRALAGAGRGGGGRMKGDGVEGIVVVGVEHLLHGGVGKGVVGLVLDSGDVGV